MSIPKIIADAIAEANAEKAAVLSKERIAEELKSKKHDQLMFRLYKEAEKWFEEALPALVKAAVLKNEDRVLIGTDSEEQFVAAQRAQVCQNNGIVVRRVQNSYYDNEWEMHRVTGETWYMEIPKV